MKFWVGSSIRVPVRQLTPGDLSVFDLNEEGGVAMTTLQQDAIDAAGPGGFIYECEVKPASVLQRNHREFTVSNHRAKLERLVMGSPDYARVLNSRYYANRKGNAAAHNDLMRSLEGLGMLGAALDFVYAAFYVTKRRQFCVDVVSIFGFDGRFYKVKKFNFDQLSPDHPNHVEVLPQVEKTFVKVFATIWNLGCVRIQKEIQLKT